jgi:hypothetical protein
MPTPELVTLAEFARRRGVSRKTTSMWKAKGWLVLRDGRVDVAASTALLNQRPPTYRGGHTNRGHTVDGATAMAEAREHLRHDDGFLSLVEAQRLKENYLMRLRKLELETASKKLIPADEAERGWMQLVSTCRAHLLALPNKLAERILLCKTPVAVEQLLRLEIHGALKELSEITYVADGDGDGGKANGGAP